MVLEYEYVMVVCWYRWELLDELTVLLLIIFGFITPVIGLRSLWLGWLPCDWTPVPMIGLLPLWLGSLPLWLDFGPCDWTTVPVIGFLPLRTGFPDLTLDFWLWDWLGLVAGFFWGLGDWSWDSFLVGLWVLYVIRLLPCCSRWVWLVLLDGYSVDIWQLSSFLMISLCI